MYREDCVFSGLDAGFFESVSVIGLHPAPAETEGEWHKEPR
jgi:hypothetical protein